METLRLKIEQLIEDLENETENRHMNDMEQGRYSALNEEHKKDFSPLTGFKCILWEKSVLDWGINNRTINVLLDI